jgi:hypothetical protein
MSQPSYSDPPVKPPGVRRREIIGAILVLLGLVTVFGCSIALGGLLALGLIVGLVACVAGALLASNPTPPDGPVS